MGIFPVWRVTHRGNVVCDIVAAAIRISERFEQLAAAVERMERTVLDSEQRVEFARAALALRFPDVESAALDPVQVLAPERPEDAGNDLWRVFNTIQSRILRGGLTRRLPSLRVRRSRAIRSIREDLRLNSALWEMAMARAA
jgi:hypothetical protein